MIMWKLLVSIKFKHSFYKSEVFLPYYPGFITDAPLYLWWFTHTQVLHTLGIFPYFHSGYAYSLPKPISISSTSVSEMILLI